VRKEIPDVERVTPPDRTRLFQGRTARDLGPDAERVQGFGQAFGNVVMGLIFGWWFHRTRRVVPLVVAHTILDIVSFVGYHLFADQLGLS